jgi:hypothetical protein
MNDNEHISFYQFLKEPPHTVKVLLISGIFTVLTLMYLTYANVRDVGSYIDSHAGMILLQHPEMTVREAERQARADYYRNMGNDPVRRQQLIDNAKNTK